jgi:cell division septation protein DedD
MRTLLALLFSLLLADAALAQDWQLRAVCDLRKGGGNGASRGAECSQLMAEVLMLLPEKAGPGNVAVLAELSDNLEKAQATWDAPCRDPQHCPDYAWSLRYAFVSKKVLNVPRDKTFTALVCREGFSDTAPDDAACRVKLLKLLREMVTRARKEGALLAVLKCGGAEAEAIRPDGAGVAGYEVVYAFVQLPDMLPMAGGDPKANAAYAVSQIAGPPETAAAPGKGKAGEQPPAPAQSAHPAPVQKIPDIRPASARDAGQAVPSRPETVSSLGQPPSAKPASPVQSSHAPLAAGEIVMQVAALPNLAQAETLADRLRAKGIEASFEPVEADGRQFYRVLALGKGSPESFKQKLAEMGFPGAIQRR